MKSNFFERISLSEGNNLIMIFQSKVMDSAFFAYIKCSEKGVKLMREDSKSNKPRFLSEYGEVIYQDSIAAPDEKAKEFLKSWIATNGGRVFPS